MRIFDGYSSETPTATHHEEQSDDDFDVEDLEEALEGLKRNHQARKAIMETDANEDPEAGECQYEAGYATEEQSEQESEPSQRDPEASDEEPEAGNEDQQTDKEFPAQDDHTADDPDEETTSDLEIFDPTDLNKMPGRSSLREVPEVPRAGLADNRSTAELEKVVEEHRKRLTLLAQEAELQRDIQAAMAQAQDQAAKKRKEINFEETPPAKKQRYVQKTRRPAPPPANTSPKPTSPAFEPKVPPPMMSLRSNRKLTEKAKNQTLSSSDLDDLTEDQASNSDSQGDYEQDQDQESEEGEAEETSDEGFASPPRAKVNTPTPKAKGPPSKPGKKPTKDDKTPPKASKPAPKSPKNVPKKTTHPNSNEDQTQTTKAGRAVRKVKRFG